MTKTKEKKEKLVNIIVSHQLERALAIGIAKVKGLYVSDEVRGGQSICVTVPYDRRGQILECFFWMGQHSGDEKYEVGVEWN